MAKEIEKRWFLKKEVADDYCCFGPKDWREVMFLFSPNKEATYRLRRSLNESGDGFNVSQTIKVSTGDPLVRNEFECASDNTLFEAFIGKVPMLHYGFFKFFGFEVKEVCNKIIIEKEFSSIEEANNFNLEEEIKNISNKGVELPDVLKDYKKWIDVTDDNKYTLLNLYIEYTGL